jgi:hypothetical protein
MEWGVKGLLTDCIMGMAGIALMELTIKIGNLSYQEGLHDCYKRPFDTSALIACKTFLLLTHQIFLLTFGIKILGYLG